jgi:hypothetical protein
VGKRGIRAPFGEAPEPTVDPVAGRMAEGQGEEGEQLMYYVPGIIRE